MCSSTALIPYAAEYADTDRLILNCASRYAEEGRKYLGKRFILRKEAEAHPEKIPALVCQTLEMCEQSLHRGFLWSAKCLSTGHEISLFGTAHVSTVTKLEYSFSSLFHPLVREKFKQSECLCVELDITKDLTLPEMQALDEADLECRKRYSFEKKPVPLSELNEHILGMIQQVGVGLDEGLIREAYEVKKTVVSLETFSVQLDFVKKTPPVWPENNLDILDSTQSGNLDQMCDVVKHYLETDPTLEERNRAFTLKIKQALKTGQKAMFALGFLHFMGETGVLKLLSSEPDIKISRIDLP